MLKSIAAVALGKFGYEAIRQTDLKALRSRSLELDHCRKTLQDYDFFRAFPSDMVGRMLDLVPRSRSQLRQDLFVLNELGYKKDGYFIEFGATNGIDLSNTYLLEKEFGWCGILAEPARCWHDALVQARTSIIETRCIWSRSGERLSFSEVANPELSTIDQFVDMDHHRQARQDCTSYSVETISLNDLLESRNSPAEIDYLSIDTEGSEYEILSAFDFSKYRIKIITVEHNFTPMRERLKEMLEGYGYRRQFEAISRWDDWYVLPEAARESRL
jgi:FkbM family methyltransferase